MAHPAYLRRRAPGRFTNDEFIDFVAGQPAQEWWQMLDGEATTMAPPSLQRLLLASNLARLLNTHAPINERGAFALQSTGIVLSEAGRWCPRVDLALVNGRTNADPGWASRFLLVAEVLCDDNPAAEIERRAPYYMEQSENLYVMVIAQDRPTVEIWSRQADWQAVEFADLDDIVELPDFGFTTTLRAIYNGTVIAPAH